MCAEASSGLAHPDNSMLLRLPARAANLSLARAAVAAFAAHLPFTVEDLEDIKVAISEAVSNVILHAYSMQPGEVTLTATIQGHQLEVTVEDQGRGIADIAQARQPSFTTSPDRMGLGFVLMESFMDDVEVDSAPGRGTVIRLRKVASERRAQGGGTGPDGGEPPQPAL
jgi:stage II sporulation protein AB (anti-sigma F factor)